MPASCQMPPDRVIADPQNGRDALAGGHQVVFRDTEPGAAGGVQRGKVGVAAGAVHEAGAGKGQHFSICGPVGAQLFGCIEQLRRTGAAA